MTPSPKGKGENNQKHIKGALTPGSVKFKKVVNAQLDSIQAKKGKDNEKSQVAKINKNDADTFLSAIMDLASDSVRKPTDIFGSTKGVTIDSSDINNAVNADKLQLCRILRRGKLGI